MRSLRRLLRGATPRSLLTTTALGVSAGSVSALLFALVQRLLSASSHGTIIAAYFGLCILTLATKAASRAVLDRFVQTKAYETRLELCDRILATSVQNLEDKGAARLMSSLVEDTSLVARALSELPGMLTNATMLIAGLVYLAWIDWRILLPLLGFIATVVPIFHRGNLRLHQCYRREGAEFAHLVGGFEGLLHGAKELRLHRRRREVFWATELQARAYRLLDELMGSNRVGMWLGTTLDALYLTIIGVMILAGRSLFGMTQAATASFIIVFLLLLAPIRALVEAIPSLLKASSALSRIDELALALVPEDDKHPTEERVELQTCVELRGVCHRYRREHDNSEFSLGPIDLDVRRGELLFIVGGNGSGKSTLAKLLVGVYEPEQGQIRIDGRLVGAETVQAYREHFSVVFSDFHLFDDLQSSSLSGAGLDDEARKHLDRLELGRKVQVSDGHLSTTRLSQGQRKRLALLTLLLDDRPIVVLDEWASDQDPAFKRLFYEELLPELRQRDKAVVVITHDDRYFAVADRILKLEDGRIVREEAVRSRPPSGEPSAARVSSHTTTSVQSK